MTASTGSLKSRAGKAAAGPMATILMATALVAATLVAATLALALGAPAASAQSFSCATASAADEVAICRSPRLQQLDVKMATLYGSLKRLMGMGARGALVDDQRDWLSRRAQCGSDSVCLVATYQARIRVLDRMMSDIAARGPF